MLKEARTAMDDREAKVILFKIKFIAQLCVKQLGLNSVLAVKKNQFDIVLVCLYGWFNFTNSRGT